jgi:hypothetical protein
MSYMSAYRRMASEALGTLSLPSTTSLYVAKGREWEALPVGCDVVGSRYKNRYVAPIVPHVFHSSKVLLFW